MRAEAQIPLFFSSILVLGMQNPQSKMSINPLKKIFSQSLSNREVVLPPIVMSANFSVGFSGGIFFPSNSSILWH